MKNQTVIYPGTFDPITNGHLDLIKRAANMFPHIIVAVAESPRKSTLFSLQERVELVKDSLQGIDNISVEGFSGLLVSFAQEKQASLLIRGLRTTMDFEYEFGLTSMYQQLMPELESIFLTPKAEFAFLSSTIVRETALHGGDVSRFVPPCVLTKLLEKVDD